MIHSQSCKRKKGRRSEGSREEGKKEGEKREGKRERKKLRTHDSTVKEVKCLTGLLAHRHFGRQRRQA